MRQTVFLLLVFVIAGVSSIWSSESRPAAEAEAELIDADRRFAAETEARGLDGWMSFFAKDAARLSLGGKAARGLAEIRARDRTIFADPTIKLRWDPTDAGVFEDGIHGFTTGRYLLIKTGSPPDTLSTGGYVSIWRREEGAWKIILDTGAADPE
jgi:ketosteroid isomerase-like protein